MKMGKLLKSDIKKLQVSSTSRNDKSFGKQFMFDGREDTCWSSDEGTPQWIYIELKEDRIINDFSIQFQGGFVGQKCKVEFNNDQKSSEIFYPENVNSVQDFTLKTPVQCNQIKFIFEESTDFFGRVVVYSLDF